MEPAYSFAYQPIVDVERRVVESFEALVRGPQNQGAHWVLDQFDADALRQFDIDARLRAVMLAAKLGLPCRLNLNVLPRSVDAAGTMALSTTVDMATLAGLDPGQLVFELSEREVVSDTRTFTQRANMCRSMGVRFAIDDFGAGHSGLNLLAEFQPEAIKLDMMLVRDIHRRGPRQAIVRGVLRTCEDLGIDTIAEGVETRAEYEWLRDEGIVLYQGYFFARPAFEALPDIDWPD